MCPIKNVLRFLPSLLWCLLALSSCRGDDELLVPASTQTAMTGGRSFYLLNEGNMGSNKATLDFYDGEDGTYRHNLFPQQNPTIAFELGDVGNDIGVYGTKLYAVINVSGLVEVMEARTARHIRTVYIPNCRYICFCEGKAYVTSYAGSVSTDNPAQRRGFVARIDTATLAIEATCEVGYQPEQMAICEGKLFVANSGGYQAPNYDHTVSVIDLQSFRMTHSINIAPNLHHIKSYNGRLYVGSRGNYTDVASDIYVLNPTSLTLEGSLGVEADEFCFLQNELIALQGGFNGKSIVRYDLDTHTTRDFITDGTLSDIQTPYGLAADEQTHHIYITDARDYVSPGRVICYDESGKRLWEVQAGDIPAHFAFADGVEINGKNTEGDNKQGVSRIYAYCPAPGQFVNILPEGTDHDTEATMNAKVLAAIGEGRQGLVTLGAAGGYIIAGFAQRVPNVIGAFDIEVLGNAFENASEAGIVSVMRDDNGNGLPDDTWYELAGSAHHEAQQEFTLAYYRPTDSHTIVTNNESWCYDAQYIAWQDGNGRTGWIPQNIYHRQPYFPRWITKDELRFTFTLLPDHAYKNGETWLQPAFEWGYADNKPNGTDGCRFDISWAIDADGLSVNLDGIDFIRIHTAVFRSMGSIGEASTEISGIHILH